MTGFSLLLYTISFAIGCMSLALIIVFALQKKYVWTKYLIVCHSSLLGSMMISSLLILSKVFLNGWKLTALNTIFTLVNLADITFLIVFIPYFTTWIIASPWRGPYKFLFYSLATINFILGILKLFYFNNALESFRTSIFVFVLTFCFSVMLKNLSSISEKKVRMVSISIIIASVALLPFVGVGFFYPSVRYLINGFYFLAWSIILLVFFFIFFGNLQKKIEEPKVLTQESLSQFRITNREFSVIELIAKGLTNKEIATQLSISVNTVNNHVANIFTKTEVRSRIDLLNLIRDAW